MRYTLEEFTKGLEIYNSMCDKASEIIDVVFKGYSESVFDDWNIEFYTFFTSLLNEEQRNWVDYFVFELDFGSRYDVGMVSGADGEPIYLETVEELYAFLETLEEK